MYSNSKETILKYLLPVLFGYTKPEFGIQTGLFISLDKEDIELEFQLK